MLASRTILEECVKNWGWKACTKSFTTSYNTFELVVYVEKNNRNNAIVLAAMAWITLQWQGGIPRMEISLWSLCSYHNKNTGNYDMRVLELQLIDDCGVANTKKAELH